MGNVRALGTVSDFYLNLLVRKIFKLEKKQSFVNPAVWRMTQFAIDCSSVRRI